MRAESAVVGHPTTGLTFTVDCPDCGPHLAIDNPWGTNGTEAKVIVRCAHCKRRYIIRTVIEPV